MNSPTVDRGTCHVMFAYDVGQAINLDEAERLISEVKKREIIKHRRRAPQHFQYHPLPLRLSLTTQPIQVGASQTSETVDVVCYDFGAISISYRLSLNGSLSSLLEMSQALYDNAALMEDARRRVDALMQELRPAVLRPLAKSFVEDYVIFHIQQMSPSIAAEALTAEHDQMLAQILRCESGELSAQEITDALHVRLTYGVQDVVIIDWNAAIVLDPESADDVRSVLEYANVQLLELRYLDRELDDALDEAYAVLSKQSWRRNIMGISTADMRSVSRLQADGAILFESVNNALKLIGDQYLARAYRLASQRFRLAEWDDGITRKLQALESIYQKLSDRQASFRLEILEWIVILLIAVSILLSLVPNMAGH